MVRDQVWEGSCIAPVSSLCWDVKWMFGIEDWNEGFDLHSLWLKLFRFKAQVSEIHKVASKGVSQVRSAVGWPLRSTVFLLLSTSVLKYFLHFSPLNNRHLGRTQFWTLNPAPLFLHQTTTFLVGPGLIFILPFLLDNCLHGFSLDVSWLRSSTFRHAFDHLDSGFTGRFGQLVFLQLTICPPCFYDRMRTLVTGISNPMAARRSSLLSPSITWLRKDSSLTHSTPEA